MISDGNRLCVWLLSFPVQGGITKTPLSQTRKGIVQQFGEYT